MIPNDRDQRASPSDVEWIDEPGLEDDEHVRSRVREIIRPNPPPLVDEAGGMRELALPISTIAASIVVVLIALAVAFSPFATRFRSVHAEVSSFLSAEGLVLAEFRRQTEEQLAEKDRTIKQALDSLAALEAEREELDALLETRVEQREAELIAALDARLAEERERLSDQGISSEELERRLAELRTSAAGEIVQSVDAYRREVESEVRERAISILADQAAVRSTLQRATSERSELLDSEPAGELALLQDDSETARAVEAARKEVQSNDRSADSIAAGDSFRNDEEFAELQSELDAARSRELKQTREIESLQLQVQSLRESLQSADRDVTLADANAELQAQIASLEADVALRDLDIAELQEQNSTAPTEASESRLGAVAQQARTQALRDALLAVRSYPNEDPDDIATRLGASGGDREIAEGILASIDTIVVAAQREIIDAQLEFRALGTVAFTGSEEVTIQRLVTVPLASGALAEIRRTVGSEVQVIATGVVREVESQRFSVVLREIANGEVVAVGDRVFVAVPR